MCLEKINVWAALKKPADIQGPNMFVWQKSLSTLSPEIFGNSIKVHHLGETIRGVEFYAGLSLGKIKIFFIDEALIGSQHKHITIAQRS